ARIVTIRISLPSAARTYGQQSSYYYCRGDPGKGLALKRSPDLAREIQFVAQLAETARYNVARARDFLAKFLGWLVVSRFFSHSRSFFSSNSVMRKRGFAIWLRATRMKISATRKCTPAAAIAIQTHETCAACATPA